MFYSVFTPSSSTATSPSLCYSPMGYLSDEEAISLESQIENSLCRIVAFDTKEEFEKYVARQDKEFWEDRMSPYDDLVGLEIHAN